MQIGRTKYVHTAGHTLDNILFVFFFKFYDTLGDVWQTLISIKNFLKIIAEHETMTERNQFLYSSSSQNLNI